ncbi:GNAT family N-acetyltransferase [Specibacter cremeus]|uniref:GNAT family N-acetyltransferase n=1 Tax=Specibacter cremeus TaxID=1629051 RepID=UPI000F79561B|nr:GNAT family N-acetyltransferase [Specibacter cremeus]
MDLSAGISIRRAGTEDVDAVAPLFDAYRQFYDCPADLQLARDYLTSRIGQADSIVFVAWSGSGEAIGFTQLYPTFCSVEASPIFVLYDLYVAPDSRQHGVGRALLTQAEEFGRAKGATRMDLSTAKTNVKAQSVYESLGWVRDEVFLHYSLFLG